MKNVNLEKKEKTLELLPLDRQPFPLVSQWTYFSLSRSLALSLSLSLQSFKGDGAPESAPINHILKNVNISVVLLGTPSFFGSIEPRFYVTIYR